MSDKLLKKGFINDNLGGLLTERYAVLGSKNKTYLLLTLKNTTNKTVNFFRLKLSQETSKIIQFNEEILPKSEKVVRIILKHNVVEFEIKATEVSLDGDILSTFESENDYISPNNIATIKEKTVLKPVANPIFAICALVLMLALSIAAAFLQLDGHMTNETFSYDGAVYSFVGDIGKNESVRLIGLRKGAQNVTIRKKVKNHDVAYFGVYDLSSNDIKKLTIEGFDSVNLSLSGCPNLTSVRLIGVKNIGESIFYNCFALKSFYAEGLETIGTKAFYNNTRLENIEIKSNFITLETGVFANLRNLKNLKIDAFINYKSHNILQSSMNIVNLSLKNLNYNFHYDGVNYEFEPVTVTDLFGKSSVRSQSLKNLEIENCDLIEESFCEAFAQLSSVKIKNGNINSINKRAFADCYSLKTLELPSYIDVLDDYALYGTAIASFDTSTLSHIGESAFSACKNLTKLDLSSNINLDYIGRAVFAASGIVEFHFPESTEIIPSMMFKDCHDLKTVTAHYLKEIEADAFYNCKSLEAVLDAEIISNQAYSKCASLTVLNLERNKEIGVNAFMGCTGLTSVSVLHDNTLVDFGAFDGCTSLTEITLPDLASYFAYIFGASHQSFANCVPPSLKKVTLIRASRIEDFAFYGCTFIKEIILPTSLHDIGERAFYGCRSLDNLILPFGLYSVGEDAFGDCNKLYEVTNLSSLSIERGQTSHGKVGYYAKAVYKSTGQLRLPRFYYGDFEFIYDYANWYLINVAENSNELNFPKSVSYNSTIFHSYYIADYLIIENKLVDFISIPSSVMRIGEEAFNCPNLIKLDIGAVKEIGFGAFRGCVQMTEITIPYIGGGGIDGDLRPDPQGGGTDNNYFSYIFGSERLGSGDCPIDLCIITVTSADTIPAQAFYGIRSVETINLPATVTSIGNSAFYNCYNLREINLGQRLTHIGESAFYNSGIRELVLPSSLVLIGEEAFRSSLALRKVTLNSSPHIDDMAFFGCRALSEVVNNGNLNIIAGSESFGHIAFYVEELGEE